jgi:hypothetical protein
MDLSAIKKRLETVNSKPTKKEKIDYKAIFWKPKPGKYQIRIIPSIFNKQNPFREIYLHYGFTKFPVLALNNWGEPDPIIEFAKSLRKSSDKEDWQLAKKLDPKMRVFVPVIVRGEEQLGTRLWEFGKEIYTQLLGIACDEDYGDYTDIVEGRDFTVEATETEVAGRKATKCNIRVKPKTSPITTDKDLLERILTKQPDILAINKKHSYEELKDILQKWLHPETESSDDDTPTVAEAAEEVSNELNDLPWEDDSASKSKQTPKNKFDEIFKD